MPWSPVILPVSEPDIIGPPCRLQKQYEGMISNGNVLKPHLPLVRVPGILKHCFYLLNGRRVLLPENLISNDPGQHMAGDVPGRSGNGQYAKREKYKGCY